MKAFEDLQSQLKKIDEYGHAMSVLAWDMRTKMPKKGADAHIASLTMISGELFKLGTSDELKACLDVLSQEEELSKLDEVSRKMVLSVKEDYERSKNIPPDLFKRYVEVQNQSKNAWYTAKYENDVETMLAYFEEMVDLNIQMAGYIDPGKKPYDVLLHDYEKGITQDDLTKVFKELKEGIVPLIKAIAEKPAVDVSKVIGAFDKEAQEKLSDYILEVMKYDLERGRLDESEHPFTIGHAPFDVRITTSYDLSDIRPSLFSVLHEGGHALYEQHINPELVGTGLNKGASMGIHESQSRFYENMIGKNERFWHKHYAKVQELFPQLKEVSEAEFYQLINVVEPSLIRVDADELTYNLHIIIRFELEQALFSGELKAKDLEAAWNAKMEEYLGIVPDCAANGLLQDCHWPGGMFGYFPSYGLGNIYGGQLLAQMEQELGRVDTLLDENNLEAITAWLSSKVHQYGASKDPIELIQDICHKGLDAQPIIKYYKDKYSKIYNL